MRFHDNARYKREKKSILDDDLWVGLTPFHSNLLIGRLGVFKFLKLICQSANCESLYYFSSRMTGLNWF